jgi:uncharacterized repeat protein (TIGR01451 family)
VTDFDVPFTVPACSTDTISATAYADGGVAAYVDGHFVVGQQSLASYANFETAPITFPLHESVGPGAHVIDFIVANYTPSQNPPAAIFWQGVGLLYSITLTQVTSGCQVALCKAAGTGVAINTPETFSVTSPLGTAIVTIDAGASGLFFGNPLGNCVNLGSFGSGPITITETPAPGEEVSYISAGYLASTISLTTGTITWNPVAGAQIIVFVDQSIPTSLSIVKSASPTAYSAVGTLITYTFTVTNTGGSALTNVAVTDPMPGLSAISCFPNANPIASLAAGASATCRGTYRVTASDLDEGSINNAATATGTTPTDQIVTDTSSATIGGVQVPQLYLEKTASFTSFSAAGQLITYDYLVTNTGNVTLYNVTVADPMPGLSTISCSPNTNPLPSLAPGASVTCSATYTTTAADLAAGEVTNQATATGDAPSGAMVSSTADWVVPGPGAPFTCESPSPTDFLSQTDSPNTSLSTPTQLWSTSYSLGFYSKIGPLYAPATFATYNALGFNPTDHYLYAIRTGTGVNELLKIDAGGNVVWAKSVLGIGQATRGPTTGAFDGTGNYWVTTGKAASYDEINVATQTASVHVFHAGIGGRGWAPQDWALYGPVNAANHTYLWGMSATVIYRADLVTGAVDSWPAPLAIAAQVGADKAFGAAWTFSNGDLGLSDNRTGKILEIAIQGAATAAPVFSLVATSLGPPMATVINDGAACVGKPTDLSIVKSAPSEVTPSGTITWVLTVTNHGPGNSSGYVVNDTVPALVSQVVAPAGCTIAGVHLRCVQGALTAGDSSSLIVTGTAPATQDTCVTNAASVVANEFDPNSANNSSSVTTCTTGGWTLFDALLSLDKSPSSARPVPQSSTTPFTFTVENTNPVSGIAVDGGPDLGGLSDIVITDTLNNSPPPDCGGTAANVIPALSSGMSVNCVVPLTASEVLHGVTFDVMSRGRTAAGHLVVHRSVKFVERRAKSQTITFGALANKTLAQSPVSVRATASSGLSVTFTTTTPSVCTSSGRDGAIIKLHKAGGCTVKAAQGGNATYRAAIPVTRSFKVTKH